MWKNMGHHVYVLVGIYCVSSLAMKTFLAHKLFAQARASISWKMKCPAPSTVPPASPSLTDQLVALRLLHSNRNLAGRVRVAWHFQLASRDMMISNIVNPQVLSAGTAYPPQSKMDSPEQIVQWSSWQKTQRSSIRDNAKKTTSKKTKNRYVINYWCQSLFL